MLLRASLVWMVSMAVLTTCLPGTPPTPTGEEPDSPWLPFLPWASNAALTLHPLQDTTGRTKRVFLSRGWGPGGYDAPPPPAPQRYTRRPLVPPSTGQDDTEQPVPSSLALRERAGRARFAALVSTQRQETQPQPQYRRFHSIFTSGTWSPLGKRSAPMGEPGIFPGMEEEAEGDSDKLEPLFTKTKPFVKDKRAGVFASQGWGAGGSPTPTWSSSSSSSSTSWTDTHHPWLAAPLITSDKTGGSGGGGERYMASFRSGGPLFHHFLSHGWRPMGR
ncbi:uncharacterized protein LOC135115998 [Scylla paramamosain]|uniref:uncharacterized protein LOC135115998 n=1 Tax=Scylla paramamosain TaxID=85552 RepID=UPI0030838B45